MASFSLILLLGTSCRKNHSDSDLLPDNRLDRVTTRRVSDNSVVSTAKYLYDNIGKLMFNLFGGSALNQYKYNVQNRLVLTTIDRVACDTLVYSANGRNVRFYRYVPYPGVSPSHAFVFDSNNGLVLDSRIISGNIVGSYNKYNYDTEGNLQSIEGYNGNLNNGTVTTYTRQDTTVFTHGESENPYYSNRFSSYLTGNLTWLALSKHNNVSATNFNGTFNPPNNSFTFSTTYYSNRLIRTQVVSNNVNTDLKREFYYQ